MAVGVEVGVAVGVEVGVLVGVWDPGSVISNSTEVSDPFVTSLAMKL